MNIDSIIKEHPELFNKNSKAKIIGQGENNSNYKVGNYTIRIERSKWADLKREYKILVNLPKGMGPEPVYLGKDYMILKYITGKHLFYLRDQHIILIAKYLKKLHKNKYDYNTHFKKKSKTLDPLKVFMQEVNDYKFSTKDPYIKKVYNYIQKSKQVLKSPKYYSLIHSDPNLMNILFNKGQVKFIDFEWSKISDPAIDIGSLFRSSLIRPWNPKFDKRKKDLFLKHYGNSSKEFRKRVELYNIIHTSMDYLFFSWFLKTKRKPAKGIKLSSYKNGLKYAKNKIKKLS